MPIHRILLTLKDVKIIIEKEYNVPADKIFISAGNELCLYDASQDDFDIACDKTPIFEFDRTEVN